MVNKLIINKEQIFIKLINQHQKVNLWIYKTTSKFKIILIKY